MNATELAHAATEKRIEITARRSGYAHVSLQGTCSADVTAEDIQRQFYHDYFGGRGAWVRDGQWGCVVHTD